MAEKSGLHAYLSWTKQRIDEMDATLASLEVMAGQMKAESKVKAGQLPAGLEKRRDEFRVTFRDVAAAQAKSWREATCKLQIEAKCAAAATRAEIHVAVQQMKGDAARTGEKLQKLKQAGHESWSVLAAALAESRKTFDQATQKAWETVKLAVSAV